MNPARTKAKSKISPISPSALLRYPVQKIPFEPNPDHRKRYPYAQLEVGESFIIPAAESKNFKSIYSYCKQKSRILKRRFVCALRSDNSVQIYREA